jgi:hypothetical protein
VKDIALHLRYESKRTDLPEDVIQTLSEAYAEISRLERKLKVANSYQTIVSEHNNLFQKLAQENTDE